MATPAEKIAVLEDQVRDLKGENKVLWETINAIRQDIYGRNASDRTSIVSQLQTLMSTRAIQIWFVSIVTGVGSAIAAGVALFVMKQPPH